MQFRTLRTPILSILTLIIAPHCYAQHDFSTDYFKIHINNKGWITSMTNVNLALVRIGNLTMYSKGFGLSEKGLKFLPEMSKEACSSSLNHLQILKIADRTNVNP